MKVGWRHQMKRCFKAFYSVSLASMVATVLACGGGVTDELKEIRHNIDQALEAVNAALSTFSSESKLWRDKLDDLHNKLKETGQKALADDLRAFTDRTIGGTGVELRCNVDFVEGKVRAYLGALKQALEETKRKLLILSDTKTARDIVAKMAVAPVDVTPTFCSFSPPSLKVAWDNPDTYRVSNATEVQGFGYALRQTPSGEKRLRVLVASTTEATRDETTHLSVTTAYTCSVNVSANGLKVRSGDSKLLVKWGDDPAHEIPIVWEPRPVKVDSKPPQVTAAIVHVHTTDDDKDKEIRFTYSIRRGKAVIASGTFGNLEVWGNHTHRDFTLPIPVANRFREEDRFQYVLHVRYDSTNGDPRWIGNVGVKLVVENKKDEVQALTTGDFAMGHKGSMQSMEFQFNR